MQGPSQPHLSATASIRELQVGCIGVGGQGLIDLQSIGRLARISAICDVDERNLAAATRLFPAARQYVDYRDLLDDPQVEAVSVSTPDHQHGPMVLGALQR